MNRRLIVIGAPLVLGLLEVGHPAITPSEPIIGTLAPIVTWWTILHVLQVPLFALLGWAAMHTLFWGPVTGTMAMVGSLAWVVALLAAAWAWWRGGAPWPVVGSLAASGLLLGFAHIRPFGPLACLALLITAVWIEAAAPSWRHR